MDEDRVKDPLGQYEKNMPIFRDAKPGDGYVRDMNALAKTAANIRVSSNVSSNSSNTARASAQIGAGITVAGTVLTGSWTSAGLVLAVLGAANVSARAMTSPRVVGWLARQTVAPAAALPVQLAKLKAESYAAGDQEALDAVSEIEAGLANQSAQQEGN